jgi:hypothetical protein
MARRVALRVLSLPKASKSHPLLGCCASRMLLVHARATHLLQPTHPPPFARHLPAPPCKSSSTHAPTQRPDVDGGPVRVAHQHLGRAVPAGHHVCAGACNMLHVPVSERPGAWSYMTIRMPQNYMLALRLLSGVTWAYCGMTHDV